MALASPDAELLPSPACGDEAFTAGALVGTEAASLARCDPHPAR